MKSSKYGHNTVIFGLVDGYYGAPLVQNLNEVSAVDYYALFFVFEST